MGESLQFSFPQQLVGEIVFQQENLRLCLSVQQVWRGDCFARQGLRMFSHLDINYFSSVILVWEPMKTSSLLNKLQIISLCMHVFLLLAWSKMLLMPKKNDVYLFVLLLTIS